MSSRPASNNCRFRRGSTYLEVQVAMVLFVLGLSGLVPLAVVNSKQAKTLRLRIPADTDQYLTPASDAWLAKVGGLAGVSQSAPTPKASPPVSLVDDQDSGFHVANANNWTQIVTSSAYGGSYRQSAATWRGAVATWTISNLEPYYYEVFATYPASATQASNAPYWVFDNSALRGAVAADQRVEPPGALYQGVKWKSLGVYAITSGTLKVKLYDIADGKVAADAVRIVSIGNTVQVAALSKTLSAEQITAEATVTVP